MTGSVYVFTFYSPTVGETSTYGEWLRHVHIPEGVAILDGVADGQLFKRHGEQPAMTDPLAFPLFSVYELTDEPAAVLDRAHSIVRQGYKGGQVYTRTTIHRPCGDRFGQPRLGDAIVIEFAQYPVDLRTQIHEYQRGHWLQEVAQLGGLVGAQLYEKDDADHPPIPNSAPLSYRDAVIWELEGSPRTWLDTRAQAALDTGFSTHSLSEQDRMRAAASEQRSGAYTRVI